MAERNIGKKKSPNGGGNNPKVTADPTGKVEMDPKILVKRFCFLGNLEPVYLRSADFICVETFYPKLKEIVKKLSVEELASCIGESMKGNTLPRKDGVAFVYAAYLASDVEIKLKVDIRNVISQSLRTADEFLLFCRYSRMIQALKGRKGFSKTARKAILLWYSIRSPDELRYMWRSHRGLYGLTHKGVIRMCRINDQTLGNGIVGSAFFKTCTELMKEDSVRLEADIQGISLLRTTTKKQEAVKVVKKLHLCWKDVPCNLLINASLVEQLMSKLTLMDIVMYWQLFKKYRHFDHPRIYKAIISGTGKSAQQREKIHPTVYLWKMDRIGIPVRDVKPDSADNKRTALFQRLFKNSFTMNRQLGLQVYVAITLQENYKKKFLTKYKKITYYQAAIALAFTYFKREKVVDICCFTEDKVKMMQIALEKNIQYADALEACNNFYFKKSSQRLVQPLMDALVRSQIYDLFLVIVPSAGRSNPKQCSDLLSRFIEKYRQTRNKKAKFVIVSLLKKKKSMSYSTEKNENVLEICGLDPNTGNLIDAFATNRFG